MTTLRTQEHGYHCQILMSRLYNVFQNEKKRLAEIGFPDVAILYSDAKSSMQYKDETGTMTAIFGKDGTETFYFRSADETRKVGLGTIFQTLSNRGRECELKNEECVPPQFMVIAQDYRYNREAIGIDKEQNKKSRSSFER